MAKYEATSPITLTAGETIASDLRGLLCRVNTSGQAVRTANDSGVPVVGVFAQDSMASGEPVTVNQLTGKVQMIAEAAVTAGQIVTVHADNAGDRGKVNGTNDWNGTATHVGVALEGASAGEPFQVLAVPYGVLA